MPRPSIIAALVFRCIEPPSTDKVYIIQVAEDHLGYSLICSWGRWSTYFNGGHLQSKVYHVNVLNEWSVVNQVRAHIDKRTSRGYFYVPEESKMPAHWDILGLEQKPKPVAKKPQPQYKPFQPLNPTPTPATHTPSTHTDTPFTVAGLLEMD